ncbi:MAG: pilin [Bacillota bacterium]|nr:pilin [Bacillota bacterium]
MLNEKRICKRTLLTSLMVMGTTALCFADDAPASLTAVVIPIVDLLNDMLAPLLLVVGAVGALYCVLLGVKYARAEEPQDREKAKAHLKGAIIGFVLIFVLIVLLNLLLPYLTKWAGGYQTGLTAN